VDGVACHTKVVGKRGDSGRDALGVVEQQDFGHRDLQVRLGWGTQVSGES
jgi:hypothetical protein